MLPLKVASPETVIALAASVIILSSISVPPVAHFVIVPAVPVPATVPVPPVVFKTFPLLSVPNK